jgi:uncharacterized protein (DUF2147 family)
MISAPSICEECEPLPLCGARRRFRGAIPKWRAERPAAVERRSNMLKSMMVLAAGVFGGLVSTSGYGADDALAALDTPVGLWKSFDADGRVESLVEIREDHGVLYATVRKVLASEAKGKEVKCTWCKGKRKDRPIVGMTIMGGMRKDGEIWSGGWIFDPKRDLTAKCRIELLEGGKKLKVRGYITFFVGETRYWKRIL